VAVCGNDQTLGPRPVLGAAPMVETRRYRRFGPAGRGLALALLATIGPPDRAAGEAQAASPSLLAGSCV
jgi:hypothetical protein